jgi:hypothetical protein
VSEETLKKRAETRERKAAEKAAERARLVADNKAQDAHRQRTSGLHVLTGAKAKDYVGRWAADFSVAADDYYEGQRPGRSKIILAQGNVPGDGPGKVRSSVKCPELMHDEDGTWPFADVTIEGGVSASEGKKGALELVYRCLIQHFYGGGSEWLPGNGSMVIQRDPCPTTGRLQAVGCLRIRGYDYASHLTFAATKVGDQAFPPRRQRGDDDDDDGDDDDDDDDNDEDDDDEDHGDDSNLSSYRSLGYQSEAKKERGRREREEAEEGRAWGDAAGPSAAPPSAGGARR